MYLSDQNLSGGIGLNLFENVSDKNHLTTVQTYESPIWEMYYQEELNTAQEIPPINGFDEMVMLTNQGKLWTFPIDNEQGQ